MGDSYQAIYDAVRSRISGCDVSSVVENAAHDAFDFSHMKQIVQQEICIAAAEHARPSAVYRPSVYPDGNQWCALYGANLQEGVAGFGDTPADAMTAFDKAWATERIQSTAQRKLIPPPQET